MYLYIFYPLAPCLATRLLATRIHIGTAAEVARDSLGHIRATIHALPVLPGGGHCHIAPAPRPGHLEHLDLRRVRLVRSGHRGSRALLSLRQGKSFRYADFLILNSGENRIKDPECLGLGPGIGIGLGVFGFGFSATGVHKLGALSAGNGLYFSLPFWPGTSAKPKPQVTTEGLKY